jgi:hypothetical protein
MSVVRVSKGRFDQDYVFEAERLLRESKLALDQALRALPGLLHYYVGIDKVACQLINISVWESLEDAGRMDSLAPMLAQRPILEAAGVKFETITNHETLWTITP